MNHAKSSPTAVLGGKRVLLSDGDINDGFWYTADLFENDHVGSATLTLETGIYHVSQAEWHALYYLTEAIILEDFVSPERVGHTLH